MKFKHSIGEKVLCFEPDETKARVLYNAKIIDADSIKDIKGKKFVEYKVHFQGWNHVWDRWADESFVLKDNEQNRKLQKKLARRAFKKLNLQKGRRRHHLPGVANKADSLDVNEEGSSSGESFESDFTTSTRGTREKFSESDDDFPPDKRQRLSSTSTVGASSLPPVLDVMAEEDCSSSKDEVHVRRVVSVDIPPSLLRRLEEDNAMIKRRNMLVNLPIRPTVVQILENYVKRFAINFIGATDKQRFTQNASGQPVGPEILPPEKRLNLCQEVCSDLKLLFDYALPLKLLYLPERKQFKHLILNTRIEGDSKPDIPKLELPAKSGTNPTSKKLVFEDSHDTSEPTPMDQNEPFTSVKAVHTAAEEVSAPVVATVHTPSKKRRSNSESATGYVHEHPKQHKKKTAEELLIEETHKYLIPNQPNLDQTGLSKDSQGRRRSSRLSHHETPRPFESLDSPYRMATSVAPDFQEKDLTPDREPTNGQQCTVQVDQFIFLRAPNKHSRHSSINSNKIEETSSSNSQFRQPLFNSTPSMDRDSYLSAAGSDIKNMLELKKLWEWRILPETYTPEEGATVPPSLIYGIHHFLRLFVKLPDILVKMEIPEFKLKILIKHLNTLLKFLSDYERELFEIDAYIPAA